MTPVTDLNTAQGIKTALETLGENTGIFDRVEIISGQFTDITAYKDNEEILRFSNPGNWNVDAYIAHGIQGSQKIQNLGFQRAILCKQALYIITNPSGGIVKHCIITKGSNGKCVTIIGQESNSFQITQAAFYYPMSMGDDSSLQLYTNGYRLNYFGSSASTVADRTQLIKIPVIGQIGSSDYVIGAKVVYIKQFAEEGSVMIDGKKYYCLYRFALLDE